ncbi:MAG TPA: hypothetical protein PLQ35_13950 [bacterium]|nr:hypothetical protein [bacterium]
MSAVKDRMTEVIQAPLDGATYEEIRFQDIYNSIAEDNPATWVHFTVGST